MKKTIKNAIETIKNQYNNLSVNLRLVVFNAISAILGIYFGIVKLRTVADAGWWSRVFHHNELADEKTKGWILLSLGVITLILAVTFYIKEELKYKKIDKDLQDAINEINKADAKDVEAIPC